MDEVTLKRMKKCAESPEGHDMYMIDWDNDIVECQKCGLTVQAAQDF